MKTIILSLLLITTCSFSATAQVGKTFMTKDINGNRLECIITSPSTVAICDAYSYKEKEAVVVIPEKVKTYTVTQVGGFHEGFAIGGKTVYNDRRLVEIKIPNTVISLESGAFSGCQLLHKIQLPTSLQEIGEGCFRECTSLKDIQLPNSLKKIGKRAFYECTSLEQIEIPEGILILESDTVDGECFHGGIFADCKNLKRIAFPSTLKSIGDCTFWGCESLTELSLPHSIREIGAFAFSECRNLKGINGLHSGIKLRYTKWHYSSEKAEGPFDEKLLEQTKSSFMYYFLSKIYQEIPTWQQKRDFENTAEYKARVTPENQQKKVQEYLAKAIKEYTDKNKIQVTLGQYDADTETYTLNSNYGTKYVKVARAEAPAFKENFSNATFDASYVMGEDYPQVSDMSIFVNGKSYRTEKTVIESSNYDLAIDLPDINLDAVKNAKTGNTVNPTTIDRTIDESIPTGLKNNSTTYAVIIGNEKYTQVAKVPYAQNDAKVFAEYCKKTLGLPVQNVRVYENATFGTMLTAINDVKQIAEAYNGSINIIFYYAGHGVPNETTKDAYLLPADADGRQTEACYSVSRLYKELGEMGAKNVVVFMDACFSGAQRGEGMLASARGVALKTKAETPQGNMVVFSAATGDETAYPYNEKGHGMFTYFLLKKLQETKGDCTLGELGEYIQQNVRQQSVVVNRKSQTPTVVPSTRIGTDWKAWKLK